MNAGEEFELSTKASGAAGPAGRPKRIQRDELVAQLKLSPSFQGTFGQTRSRRTWSLLVTYTLSGPFFGPTWVLFFRAAFILQNHFHNSRICFLIRSFHRQTIILIDLAAHEQLITVNISWLMSINVQLHFIQRRPQGQQQGSCQQ